MWWLTDVYKTSHWKFLACCTWLSTVCSAEGSVQQARTTGQLPKKLKTKKKHKHVSWRVPVETFSENTPRENQNKQTTTTTLTIQKTKTLLINVSDMQYGFSCLRFLGPEGGRIEAWQTDSCAISLRYVALACSPLAKCRVELLSLWERTGLDAPGYENTVPINTFQCVAKDRIQEWASLSSARKGEDRVWTALI